MNAEAVLRIIKGICHPRRYAIAYLVLHEGPISVKNVHEGLGLDQAKTSLDLNILKKAGAVDSTRRGGMVYYEVLPEVERLLEAIFDASNGIKDLLEDEVEND